MNPEPETTSPAPLLAVDRLSQEFRDGANVKRVLHDITFSVDDSSVVCVLGPSGCGKSTIIRMISGMYDRRAPMPTTGEVRINGAVVRGPQDEVVTMFQRPVLTAWLDVREHVLLPFRSRLWGRNVSRGERIQRVDAMLEAVGLRSSARLYPRQLSGGMQQRVALAARLVIRPAILCLDEPFSSLDLQTRLEMQDLVHNLWRDYACLAFFVTHDVTEALRLADRILVLSSGPARIMADIAVTAPKPRTDRWLRSPEGTKMAQEISELIRGAAGQAAQQDDHRSMRG
jgi:NitT/TauT family transport system ATP-binding protein